LTTTVDQTGAVAGLDIVARDKITNINYGPTPAGYVETLMARLAEEIKTKQEVRDIIDALQFFYNKKASDEVIGLEAKLLKAKRQDELLFAFEKKELFVKLLDRFSLYASAQRIFAYLLAKAEHQFISAVQPKIPECDQAELNAIITTKIVEPIVAECGIGLFDVNHSVVMGMVYWLAEQCFVRWHQ
jgi:hypothetical protein